MCETFSKEGKSSIEAAAIAKVQGKIFLRCVTLSNWKGKAANAMQRVLQDVLYWQGGKAAGKEKLQAQKNRYSYDSGTKAAGRDVIHGCSQPFQMCFLRRWYLPAKDF